MMLMARVNSGQASSGEGYEMDVITGVLLMGTLSNGMVLMNVSEYWQKVVKGLVLILAVTLDRLVQQKKTIKN